MARLLLVGPPVLHCSLIARVGLGTAPLTAPSQQMSNAWMTEFCQNAAVKSRPRLGPSRDDHSTAQEFRSNRCRPRVSVLSTESLIDSAQLTESRPP